MGSEIRSRATRGTSLVLVLATLATVLVVSPPHRPAKAIHNKIDGCGQTGALSIFTPDFDLLAGFDLLTLAAVFDDDAEFFKLQEACNRHDLCYGTVGIWQSNCDDAMWPNLEKACRSKYLPDSDWKSWLTPWRVGLYPVCITEIPFYWFGVAWRGHTSYGPAQQHARDEAACPANQRPVISGIKLNFDLIKETWGTGQNAGAVESSTSHTVTGPVELASTVGGALSR